MRTRSKNPNIAEIYSTYAIINFHIFIFYVLLKRIRPTFRYILKKKKSNFLVRKINLLKVKHLLFIILLHSVERIFCSTKGTTISTNIAFLQKVELFLYSAVTIEHIVIAKIKQLYKYLAK